jgi:hypothetical protein
MVLPPSRDDMHLRVTLFVRRSSGSPAADISTVELDRLMAAVCATLGVERIQVTTIGAIPVANILQHVRTAACLAPSVGVQADGVDLGSAMHDLRRADPERIIVGPDAGGRLALTCQGRLHAGPADSRGTDLVPLLRAGDFVSLDAAIRSTAASA